MPTYEYECTKCGKTFEAHQTMSEAPIAICPDKKCKGKVKRLIGSGAGIIFKGSGFYQTDYKSTKGGGDSKMETKDASNPGAKTDAKTSEKSGGGCGSGCGCSKH